MAKRDLGAVIDQMLTEVPEEEGAFRGRLEAIKQSVRYAAPEAVVVHWNRTGTALEDAFGFPPAEDWQRRVVAAFLGETAPGAG